MMSTQTSSDVSLEFALAVKNRETDFNSEDEEEINEEMALLDMSKPRYSYQNLISIPISLSKSSQDLTFLGKFMQAQICTFFAYLLLL